MYIFTIPREKFDERAPDKRIIRQLISKHISLVDKGFRHQCNLIKEHTSQCNTLNKILRTFIFTAKDVEIVFNTILPHNYQVVCSVIRDRVTS